MKRIFLLSTFFLFCATFTFAQRTITGTLTDNTGEPIIGANILAKGSSTGTVSDLDGNFSLSLADSLNTLVISYTGYSTKEVDVSTTSVVKIVMLEGALLQEVVVTALGVERSEKALGYAVQEVDANDIVRSGATNAVDALVGKASGVQVTRSSGSVGGGSRILIRGVSSMVGNNQPLIVIDGVRTNNETLLSQANTAGTAGSNRLMDLNPEDIASINVLKGAAATSLYGTAGSTGVVLITTKKGANKSKVDVEFSTSLSFDNITNMIALQNEFAQGSGGAYRDPSSGSSTSWGPRISDLEYATDPNHPDAPGAAGFDAEGKYKFDKNGFLVPKGAGNGTAANVYNNVDPFFQTAISSNSSLAISGGSDIATFRLSISNLEANGVVPNEEYDRKTVKLASTLTPIDGLTLSGSVNYTKSDYVRVQQGSNTSGLLLGMLRTPISFDNTNGLGTEGANSTEDPSAYQFPDFKQRNYRGGGGYDNPYWIINKALGYENVDRTFGNIKADYKFSNWFGVGLNIGYDLTSDVRKQEFEINSRTNASGAVRHDEYSTKQFDNYLTFLGAGNISDDISLNYTAGVNAFSFNNHQLAVRANGLVFPGFVDVSNATSVSSFEDINRYRSLGFFGQVEAGWNNTLYLTLTARQDYDSRLGNPADFKLEDTGFFYPSASLAFVFSEFMNTSSGPFSFGKLRLSYARVGAPPPNAYSTRSVFVSPSIGDGWGDDIIFPISGQSAFDQSSLLGNPNLTPELSSTLEVGLDLRFFNGKLGLDVTAYDRDTEDAILNASLTPSTGFTNVWLNSGEMASKGIEITLNAIPVQTDKFEWNTQINWTKSENIVTKLAPGIERLFLAGFNSAGTYLVAGNQYGAIFGGAYLRQEAGGPNDTDLNIPGGPVVINDDPSSPEYGFQAVDPSQRSIGNPNPDFILGWNNTLTYDKFSFNFLFDWRQGGDLWNGTAWALSFFGRSQLTAETREETPVPIEGVLSDGSPNNIPVARDQSYWTSSLGGFGAIGEQFVQDGGWVRLREVGLSYRIPSGKVLKGGSIGVSGRNLWLDTDYDGIDPETSLTGTGNGQGFDYFNMPATKSFLVKLNLKF